MPEHLTGLCKASLQLHALLRNTGDTAHPDTEVQSTQIAVQLGLIGSLKQVSKRSQKKVLQKKQICYTVILNNQ